ncbi:interferon-inducible GTPase 5-like [Dreissena polymorpha]|uniref:interferon-inducible GTPase 5-like n=1 Tax=Dreissena polymorpha TaxID=45954 RepID=UPI002263CF5A|nr:interferon-inducible GTPase 5-like [Dreissena polymorpha]
MGARRCGDSQTVCDAARKSPRPARHPQETPRQSSTVPGPFGQPQETPRRCQESPRSSGHLRENPRQSVTVRRPSGAQTILAGILEAFDKCDVSKARERIKTDLNLWKDCKIKIAVIGGSGTGKSSFINALLGFHPTHENAAKVGATETTMRMEKFINPKYPNLEFWDLPGVGTANFPKETYLKTIEFERYDFYI